MEESTGSLGRQKVIQAQRDRQRSFEKVEPRITDWPSQLVSPCTNLPRSLLTESEIRLTEEYSVKELLHKLRQRTVTAEEVTRAFLRRAAIAQHATNCLTELLWDQAIERAKSLDSLPGPLGPLHGLPISTKENQGMRGKGQTCNTGYVAWIGRPSDSNFLHDVLWNAGCVFYARTTLPQTVMHLETNNNITGRTVNPYNLDHTSGGSSGGEGALVAMRGSLLGIGGDIGGSIRVPAAFNGVYGYKPTSSRFPVGGSRVHMQGKDTIAGVNGPICTDRDTIEVLMKVVMDAKPWRSDPGVIPQPWSPYTFTKPLKIAIQWSDDIVCPHPPVTRALREVAAACKAAGMKVIDWVSLDHAKGWNITSGLYFPDGGEEVLGLLKEAGESVLPLTKFIIEEQPNVKNRTQKELWNLCLERDRYRSLYARHWSDTDQDGDEVDVILGPAYPGAAPPHDCARYWSYTSTWNLLDYPSVVFPVTKVSLEDHKDTSYSPKNVQDKYNYDLYENAAYLGLPVNLQLIARRNYDEKLLAALALVEQAIKRLRERNSEFSI
ncbi:Acetamidase [Exophiala dermatitidis]